MTPMKDRKALVLGASAGIGRATALKLAAEGAQVVGVARGAEGLTRLRAEAPQITTEVGDASDRATVERLLREVRPEVVVLAAGVAPHTAPIVEHTWETFSEAWTVDTRAAFHLAQAALALPLSPGGVVVILSSGAALNGSPLSGGYAGAKRMSWWLAAYAQQHADARGLGLRFVAVLPKQLVEGTAIARRAAAGYSRWLGITPEAYMARFEVPLHPEGVAAAVLDAIEGRVPPVVALGVTGRGVEPIG